MKYNYLLVLIFAIILLFGCSKKTDINVKEWAQYQDQIFKVSFNYPKDWLVANEQSRVTITSSLSAAEKFFAHDPRKEDGIQIIVGSEKIDTIKDYEKYAKKFADMKVAENFTVKGIIDTKLDGMPAKEVSYTGAIDEKNRISAVFIATLKDSVFYYVHYLAYNSMYASGKFILDTVSSSLMLPKKVVVEKGVDPAIPVADVTRYADAHIQLSHPINFGPIDGVKKGDVISSIRIIGNTKVSRNDCTIDIDVRPSKKLTVEKVVEQNTKFFNPTSKGETKIDGNKAIFLNYTPKNVKNVNSRVYFVVKNEKIYRIILNYYAPMKKDFLPAFEKIVASIRLL